MYSTCPRQSKLKYITRNKINIDYLYLEIQEQTGKLEREQNERDVLEAVSDYKCPPGMSLENVPAYACQQ
jgi:hypothetical protein